MDIFTVKIVPEVRKNLRKLPSQVYNKFLFWVKQVTAKGLSKTRKTRGYRDKPLKGKRKGQYSVRLNRSYRVIYEVNKGVEVKFIEVVEVNKHEY